MIPVIGIYDDVDEIDFKALPEQFVMKWNFGWQTNYICKDKNKIDEKEFFDTLRRWEKSKFYLISSEMHYKNIHKRLICEKFIGTNNSLPIDYKFYCFDGQSQYVMLCEDRETSNTRFLFFDRNWNLQRFDKQGEKLPDHYTVPKPDNIEKMFEIASKLSEGFKFVRVDLYNIEGKIYFGELTFTPCAGLDNSFTESGDLFLGSLINL